MTYKEKYEQYTDIKKLITEVKADITLAKFIATSGGYTSDRVSKIIEAAESVLNSNFSDISDETIEELNKFIGAK